MLSALYPLLTAKARFSFESEITSGLLKSRKVTPFELTELTAGDMPTTDEMAKNAL